MEVLSFDTREAVVNYILEDFKRDGPLESSMEPFAVGISKLWENGEVSFSLEGSDRRLIVNGISLKE